MLVDRPLFCGAQSKLVLVMQKAVGEAEWTSFMSSLSERL